MASTVATTTFEYDNRKRLTGETRVINSQAVYDFEYRYDQLGNRTHKIGGGLYVEYFYDVDFSPSDPVFGGYPTRHNRLLFYTVRASDENGALLRTVRYTYYKTGDASNITIKDEYIDSTTTPGDPNDYDWYYDLALYPYTNGGVAMAAPGRWLVDGEGEPYNYQRLAAWEFAYDDPRARYMARELDAGTLVPSGPAAWTDYLGTSPWGDFDLTYSGSTPVVSEQMRYLGTAAQQDVSSGDTRHFHGDLIGSTLLLTDEAGGTNFSPASFAYTAFGEPVTPDGSGGWRVGQPVSGAPRYAYAGEWGYETWHGSSGPMFLAGANPNLAPIRLSHVGARWYDAAIGRFVQRDPIGLAGGLNVYAYVTNTPLSCVDPMGLWGEWYPGAPWHANILLYLTPQWLDSPSATANAQRLLAIPSGIVLATCLPPAGVAAAGYGAVGWGVFRTFGGSTGIPEIDNPLDGGAIGVGIGTLPRIPTGPRGGELGGFPRTANPPYIRNPIY